MRLSELAEKIIINDGKKLDFDSFFTHKDIYDLKQTPEILLKCSRQVGKSVLEAARLILNAVSFPFFSSLHVSPQKEHRDRFVKGKLDPMLQFSPLLKSFITASRISYKEFKNGSKMYLQYAQSNADRIRGISADAIYYDEVQDILYDVIPVINECLAESKYMWKIYAGTPKSMDNTIEYLWQQSKMFEWTFKCNSCNKFLSANSKEIIFKMIDKSGIKCPYCSAKITLENIKSGKWLAENPSGRIFGFHIPRIVMAMRNEKQWKEFLIKYETYPEDKFLNEVCGLSVPLGGQPISLIELESAIGAHLSSIEKIPEFKITKLVAGIDWGIIGQNSFTILVLGGFNQDGKFLITYAKKFLETDILSVIEQIKTILSRANVILVGADFGAGATNNKILAQDFKVAEFVYISGKEEIKVSHSKIHINRTQSIDELLLQIKKKNILFPLDLQRDLFNDFLALREELTNSGNKVYIHNPNTPDDFVHAVNFCYQAGKLLEGYSFSI
ncbi:MAG: phage terminase large subunit family protein [Candidatus Aenigmatarchaeota archaeon]